MKFIKHAAVTMPFATLLVASALATGLGGYRTLVPDAPELDARTIMQRAHEAAGGESWVRPVSLTLNGYAVFYRGGHAIRHETHNMWRVYERGKKDAHVADGKVRIESLRDGIPVINLSFDGSATYTDAGRSPRSAADAQWSSSFGFGVVRHALDNGYALARLPDDLVDGRPAWVVNVTDPAGGETRFAISQEDFAIVRVGFDTPRGWHERVYSDFFSNPGERWRQPRRVRLYYDGVKSNEVIWTHYAIDKALPDCLFVLPEAAGCRDEARTRARPQAAEYDESRHDTG